MALKLIEGYDNMSTVAKFAAKGWSLSHASATGSEAMTAGRINGQAFRATTGTTSNINSFFKSLPAALTTLYVGFAHRFSTTPSGTTSRRMFALRNGATLTVQINITATGLIQVLNSSGTQVAIGTTTLITNTWYFIEAKVFVNGASSTVEVKLNGVAEIASTVGNFGSSGIDSVGPLVESNGTGSNHDYDDIYVLDTSGSDNTTFLGDVHVETIYPFADGADDGQFVPDTGTNAAARVNEKTGTFPDDDTSYIASSTVGHKQTFDMDTLAVLSGSVFGVQTNLHSRKDDAATRQIAPVVRQGGSDFDGTSVALSTSYIDSTQIYENDPSDSADWTIGKVNSAEFGVKVIA